MANIINLYEDNREEFYTKIRITCRAIIVNEYRQILLSYASGVDKWLTPGGGIEETESYEECVIREVEEETGYIITPIIHYLTINDYHLEYKHTHHFMICEVKSDQGTKKLTEKEIRVELKPVWIDVDEALSIFGSYETYKDINEKKAGTYLRDYTAIKDALEKELI